MSLHNSEWFTVQLKSNGGSVWDNVSHKLAGCKCRGGTPPSGAPVSYGCFFAQDVKADADGMQDRCSSAVILLC